MEIANVKQSLHTLQTQLTDSLKQIAVFNEQTGDWEVSVDDVVGIDADENDIADYGEEADERIATLAELETRWRNVQRALKKIEAGTFGICEISGTPIEPDRLAVNPAARTCKAHMEEEYDLPL
jgi:RNA polymerase-binding transcription factor DksA